MNNASIRHHATTHRRASYDSDEGASSTPLLGRGLSCQGNAPAFAAVDTAIPTNRLREVDAKKHTLDYTVSAYRVAQIAGTIACGIAYLGPLSLRIKKIAAPVPGAPEVLVPRQTDHYQRLEKATYLPTTPGQTVANYARARKVAESPQAPPRPYTQAAFFRDHTFTAIFGAGFMGMYQHLGAIRAAIDVGLRPDSMAGASAGAIVAAMVGCLPIQAVEDALLSLSLLDFMDVKFETVWNERALCSGDAFVHKLQETFAPSGVTELEDRRPPLKIASFENGRTILRAEGNLVEAVRFSAGLPVLFARREGMEGGWIDEHLSLATQPGKAALIFRLSEGDPASYFERKLGRPEPLYNVPEDPMHRTLYAKAPSRLNFVNFWVDIDFNKEKLKNTVDEAYSAAMRFFASPDGNT
jgi:hypothetical protein